jgi:D-alanyl-D-alanine carboxypeptidase/D-alanyl-D-alanine-endopeptidase (penicillin-binding protein 4)
MLRQLKKFGICHINGNLVIDDSDDNNLSNSLPSGMSYEDKKFCFGAPVSALIINQNCIAATLRPTKHRQKASLKFQSTHRPTIQNTVVTNKKLQDHAVLEAHENNKYLLSGNITEPLNLKIAVQNQRLYAKETLKNLLANNQVSVHKIVFGRTKNPCTLIKHESPPLTFLLSNMLKSSDNVISNAVFKKLTVTNHMVANWDNAATVVKNYLTHRLKIDSDKIRIQDGAGLSRYNLLTPNQLIKILDDIYHHAYKSVFFNNALPISGIDGTLKNRMEDISGKVRAKTGTENAISTLAGFIEKPNHQTFIFAIMINSGISPIQKYRDLEDNICRLIYKL